MDLGFVAVILSGASLILHAVAKLTKTKVDDKIADGIDKAREVLPLVAPLLPKDKPAPTAPPSVPSAPRDHR